MHKSSIYLPDDLKAGLSALAARSGRSEAELIRGAIERLLAGAGDSPAARPEPALTLPERPALVGVGIGPGDPGLVTLRARAVLRGADRAIVTSTDARSVGRAEMVVRAIAPATRIQRVPFTIAADPSGRAESLASLGHAVIAAVDAGELVGVAVIGDPEQWTVFPDLADLVAKDRPSLAIHVEPGVASYQAAAATSRARLGRPGHPFTVVDRVDDLDRHLGGDGAVVLFKASTDAAAVRATAARHRRDDGLVAELAGLPGGRVVPLDEADDGPIAYLATVLFPSRAPAPAVGRR